MVRYSPSECMGARKERITGAPDMNYVSTSYIERQNLTMRMSMRRFTRLTNAFSKKLENHVVTVALYFVYYNFGRVHQTLRVTPGMEAGIPIAGHNNGDEGMTDSFRSRGLHIGAVVGVVSGLAVSRWVDQAFGLPGPRWFDVATAVLAATVAVFLFGLRKLKARPQYHGLLWTAFLTSAVLFGVSVAVWLVTVRGH
jgi:hypothetical protein